MPDPQSSALRSAHPVKLRLPPHLFPRHYFSRSSFKPQLRGNLLSHAYSPSPLESLLSRKSPIRPAPLWAPPPPRLGTTARFSGLRVPCLELLLCALRLRSGIQFSQPPFGALQLCGRDGSFTRFLSSLRGSEAGSCVSNSSRATQGHRPGMSCRPQYNLVAL